jgi:DsbC/DsbD-like thiol-disulfide interchange protein
MSARLAGCFFGVIFGLTRLVFGQGATPPGNAKVAARFVADVDRVKPGGDFVLGVEIKPVKGWHVYWKSPGEAGLPTTVTVKLPPGVTAGTWRYPTPSRFTPGGILSFGYEDEVVLTTTVHVPAARTDSALPIEGVVKFLVCQEQCLPGRIPLVMKLPLGGQAEQANVELFEKWGAAVPVDGKLIEGAIPAGEDEATGKVRVELPAAATGVEFFPVLPDGITMSDVAVATEGTAEGRVATEGTAEGRVAVVTFKSKRLKGVAVDEKPVEAVLGYNDEQGRRRGVRVDVPLRTGG